jgi:hypothetical protein
VNERTLRKRDVEALLADYDGDPVGALTVALRRLLDRPDASFDELVAGAGFDVERCHALVLRDVDALDALAAELNERRRLR